ncbi:MAG: hypothetical protein COA30_01760 [Sulfurimonas sp.]|nr:MAG: hypothetical protein COA30_01760 [Sulfurimonas sp.]
MLKIQRDYNDEYIVYKCMGSMNVNDLEKFESMIQEDIAKTYAFIFSFRYLHNIDADAVKFLHEVYVLGVNNACEMIISGLNMQVAIMIEVFRTDKLYTVKKNLIDAKEMLDSGYDEALYYS